jgi:hypothetical protein
MGGRHSFGDDQLLSGPEAPDRGPAQDLGGCILSALPAGIALEAAFPAR